MIKLRLKKKYLLAFALTLASVVSVGGIINSSTQVTTEEYIKRLSRENGIDYDSVKNHVAYVTSQCYTKTKDDSGKVYNPCYACHTRGKEPNFLDDSAFQTTFEFPTGGEVNPWKNLLKDRTAYVKKISDEEILRYIREDNYFDKDGEIALKKELPPDWPGYRPDCYFNFDDEGFDRHPKTGEYTGWRAFRYHPFLGTFWPTNGSTDDVLIRLSEPFMQDKNGKFNKEIYKINLAIVEAVIKQRSIKTEPLDETLVNRDLDGDGKIGTAYSIKYDWKPLENRFMYYVGMAEELQRKGELNLAGGLYPVGTEFLHTVRYIDWDDQKGTIKMSKRMKEVRYSKKVWWANYAYLHYLANKAGREVFLMGEVVPESFNGNYKFGLETGTGWILQGFIEDKKGRLRPQTNEETMNCIGCHSMIGAITDATFAFPRKLEGGRKDDVHYGWMHWSQKGLEGVKEPLIRLEDGTIKHEYAFYLMNNDSGNEFRDNDEVKNKFFNPDGSIKPEMLEKLKNDITVLLYPSRERALMLNKAYKAIVEEQSYIYGRDATVNPVKNIMREIKDDDMETGIVDRIYYEYIGLP